MVRFRNGDRKVDVMRPYLDRAARTGRSQVAAIGVAQEFATVWTARQRETDPGMSPQFSFTKEQRRVTVYYLYLWDDDFGAGVHQDLLLLPLSDQGVGQRARVGQTSGDQGRDRVHRVVQRVRLLRGPVGAAGDLRPAGTGHDPGVLRAVDLPAAAATDRGRPCRPASGGT